MLARIRLVKLLKHFNRTYSSSTSSSPGDLLELRKRGFYQDIFPDNAGPQLSKLFLAQRQVIYAGFDPTADSLHIGNLLVIMGLIHCQRLGHFPVALVGGATGLIGDPSGRSTERNQMGGSDVTDNTQFIEEQILKIFDNHKKEIWHKKREKGILYDLKIVNNAVWYQNMNLIDFISNMGRYFRMGSMLSRTSVKTRLATSEGMSFTEFTYQIFQAYDWLHLLKTHNCRFQLGGSDQMGNLMSGHELISRVENRPVFGMTLPLVTNEEGDKFGKSGGSAIWLDAKKTSPFSMYQFFIRTPDSEVERLLKLFTFVPLPEIEDIMDEQRNRPEARKAQRVLAKEVTLLVHGPDAVKKAEQISNTLYSSNIEGLGELNMEDIKQAFAGATVCEILPEEGMTVLNLAMKAKCFKTDSDACRIISAGGFYVNQKRAQNIAEIITPGIHTLKNGLTLLRVGKRNYYIIQWLI